ncbi:MAG: hypothetical protein Q9159_004947 [Coniocarpon cinnabarinum]
MEHANRSLVHASFPRPCWRQSDDIEMNKKASVRPCSSHFSRVHPGARRPDFASSECGTRTRGPSVGLAGELKPAVIAAIISLIAFFVIVAIAICTVQLLDLNKEIQRMPPNEEPRGRRQRRIQEIPRPRRPPPVYRDPRRGRRLEMRRGEMHNLSPRGQGARNRGVPPRGFRWVAPHV